MYIDYLKADYSDMPCDEQKAYIKRDKQNLGNIIRQRIANDIENIVERWYEIDDIGFINKNEEFLHLLNEAEQLYGFAYYTGTISLIGIASEEFSKYLINKNNVIDIENQLDRIDILYKNKLISKETKSSLHKIRKIRNKCVHYNIDFKNLSEYQLKECALIGIQELKKCLASILVEDYNIENDELINSKELLFNDFIYRNRNIMRKQEKIDLQIAPNIENMVFTAQYYIAEIDIESSAFKEMTLADMDRGGMPVVVDLTLPQVDMIKEMKLLEGNIIIATTLASVTTAGLTEEWHLLKIHDTYHEIISLEELGNFL